MATGISAWLSSSRAAKASSDGEEVSTTSSSHSGSVYETRKAVAEYLMFHFQDQISDFLPYSAGISPVAALNFAKRFVASAALMLDATES